MARPIKEGLDYFPLDTDIDQDDKVIIIIAKYGMQGFGILIKLLMEIYKHGYSYQWTEKEQIIFSSRVNVDINQVKDLVSDCIKWGLFHEGIYNEYGILTSKGIQERYLLATSRRVNVNINDNIKLVSVDINPKSTEKTQEENTQKKRNKTKIKDTKKDIPKTPSPKYEICDMDLANYFYSLILENNENAKKPNLETWAKDIRLMREKDNRTEEQIKYLIEWTQKDEFWKSNILSPSKLREKFDQLIVRVKSDIQKKNMQATKTLDKPKAYSSMEQWALEGEG